MADAPRPGGRKLVKRRTGSAGPSPSRDRAQSGNRHSQQDTPAVPQIDLEAPPMPQDTDTSAGKDKKSKWRLSNPFHSKDKERKDPAAVTAAHPAPIPSPPAATDRPAAARTSATTGDSAYFSSEHVNSSNDTSGHPSFSSAERRGSRGEQLLAPTASLQPPTTSVTSPTPSASVSHGHHVPQQSASPAPPAQAQQDVVQSESYTDQRTGNVVTTTTTVSLLQPQQYKSSNSIARLRLQLRQLPDQVVPRPCSNLQGMTKAYRLRRA
jgi:hypothetical protein